MRDEQRLYLCKVPFKTADKWAKTKCIMGDQKLVGRRDLTEKGRAEGVK
jgi:hypothetical protein